MFLKCRHNFMIERFRLIRGLVCTLMSLDVGNCSSLVPSMRVSARTNRLNKQTNTQTNVTNKRVAYAIIPIPRICSDVTREDIGVLNGSLHLGLQSRMFDVVAN